MNSTLKNSLMALVAAALGLGTVSGCGKSSEEPETESSSGGESTVPAGEAEGGEGSCSGEGHCGAEKHGGEAAPEGEPAPEGEAPPSP